MRQCESIICTVSSIPSHIFVSCDRWMDVSSKSKQLYRNWLPPSDVLVTVKTFEDVPVVMV